MRKEKVKILIFTLKMGLSLVLFCQNSYHNHPQVTKEQIKAGLIKQC